MQIVSTAWVNGTPEEFELAVGLGLHAPHGRASRNAPLRVFVLDGFERLPSRYREHLRSGHVEILDASPLVREWAPRLRGIAAHLNRYETFCFLRWPVLRAAMAGAPFLHLDLDIFLQPDLATVSIALENRTATRGSPCFMAISDRAWLDAWCEAILDFDRDPADMAAALNYAGTAFRSHIGSDQDLLKAQHEAGRLPRGHFGALERSHAIFVNPLYPRFGNPGAPIRAEHVEDVDLFSGRPVLFWHMQNDFARYVGRHLLASRQADGRPVPRLAAQVPGMTPTGETLAFEYLRSLAMERFRQDLGQRVLDLDRILGLVARSPLDFLVRSVATRHFVLRGEARELFSSAQWWEPGVFA
jgi:hypothetical protein